MAFFVQLLLNGIIAASVYALIALGFNLIFGVTKFFNLAHGVIIPVGGYGVFWLARILGLDLYVSCVLAVLFAGLIGLGFDYFVYRPLRNKKSSNTIMLVASLGILLAVQAIIAILFSSQFQTLGLSSDTPKVYSLAGGSVTQVQLFMFVSALIIAAGLVWLLKKTRFGMMVRAISDDEEVARITGLNSASVIAWIFFIGSAIAGFAGILIGFDTGLEPTMGLNFLLKATIAAIIGGIGNVYGSILGALLLGLVENFGIGKISGEWKDAIAFSLLLIFLIFRPKGILGK